MKKDDLKELKERFAEAGCLGIVEYLDELKDIKKVDVENATILHPDGTRTPLKETSSPRELAVYEKMFSLEFFQDMGDNLHKMSKSTLAELDALCASFAKSSKDGRKIARNPNTNPDLN